MPIIIAYMIIGQEAYDAKDNATEGCDDLKGHQLRWALLCVAASTQLLLPVISRASQTVVVKPGDSIDSLARKYHVAIKDIARANGISSNAVIIDGHKLSIPDAPRSVVKEAVLHVPAAIKGDRITIRQGPNENYRRLILLDHGSQLTVTRKAGEWYQVQLADGKIGWVKQEFVVAGDPKHVAKVIARYVPPKETAHTAKKHIARRNQDDEDSTPVTRHKKKRVQVTQKSRHRSERSARVDRSSSRRRGGSRPEANAPGTNSDVVRSAYAYRGVPYHWGGTSRSGFDCSGFTSYVYRNKGVALPHSASGQFGEGRKVSSGSMKPGDLVFFHTTRRGISHVGIYAGKGKFVHASSGGGHVRVDTLNSGYYKSRLVGARRVK